MAGSVWVKNCPNRTKLIIRKNQTKLVWLGRFDQSGSVCVHPYYNLKHLLYFMRIFHEGFAV